MKRYIVITSIFDPTEAVKRFALLKDYHVVVVGDKKSPLVYDCDNVTFLSVNESLGFEIEKVLPYNHYSRKMIGYLYAISNGADVIIDSDDDNLALENFSFPEFKGKYKYIGEDASFVNVYKYFTEQKIWPRGLPLEAIDNYKEYEKNKKTFNVGCWQGLADEDPDVDAIYRLTNNTPCYFNKDVEPFVLEKGTLSPFNTQNTAFIKKIFPLLYLPSLVSFRFTDILKGLIAQPIMWNEGVRLGFTTSTVLQKRNEHNYMKDFAMEIPCYLHANKVVELAKNAVLPENDIYDNLYNVYLSLVENEIVEKGELEILKAWILDCKKLLGK